MLSKGTFGPKLKYVEITIPSLQKRVAKQVNGDAFQQTSCCQTLADMSSISCAKTIFTQVYSYIDGVLHWRDLAAKDN